MNLPSNAQSIVFDKRNATVWEPRQEISGIIRGHVRTTVDIYHNDEVLEIEAVDGSFAFQANLHYGENVFRARCPEAPSNCLSDTLSLTLGYNPLPLAIPYADIQDDLATLRIRLVENPGNLPRSFEWVSEQSNPAACQLVTKSDSITVVKIPNVDGNYFFNLIVKSLLDTVKFQTYVIRNGAELKAFDIKSGYARWIDSAIVYQITPHAFSESGDYLGIKQKLPEIKALGVNTIYLQPVYRTQRGGQGYDVVDYFSLRPDLGTEAQLHDLIRAAKELGLRVLFDFVPNHTSIRHPYAVSGMTHGLSSHYYHFYQRSFDGKKYSSAYHRDKDGFIYYFWEDLVNLNYDHPEVQRLILEACKHWVRKFDIDGYRFDAVWGVNARNPRFGKRLRMELKSIKPDILLLAEDKPGEAVFASGFDAAYDWTSDTSWVSQVSWQYEYDEKESKTIFNFPDVNKRADMLTSSVLESPGFGRPILRFMENNDLPRFGVHHTPRQERMVAALFLSLPGIPMLYNGQEAGMKSHPYSRHSLFSAERSIRSMNPELFDYYSKLLQLRKTFHWLHAWEIARIPLTEAPHVVAFRRGKGDAQLMIVTNLGGQVAQAGFQKSDFAGRRFATDLITGKKILMRSDPDKRDLLKVEVDAFSTLWLLLD